MRRTNSLLTVIVTVLSILTTTLAEEDKCPKGDYACLDVINSSLCLSTNAGRGTEEALAAMAKCVDYPGGMSDLPGAQKVSYLSRRGETRSRLIIMMQLCRCPGCHSTSINEAIAKAYPPPCAA